MPTKNSETVFNKILKDFAYHGDQYKTKLIATTIDTPIGELIAVSNEKSIYLLQVLKEEFSYAHLKRFTDKTKSHITQGRSRPIDLLEQELKDYFNGTLEVFTTPIEMHGTDFQIQVWKQLRNIPFGKQISYAQLADNVKSVRPKSSSAMAPVRAVGTANGANRILLLIPCHRVINKSGKMGGFSCGIERKEWLLKHEGQTF